MSDNNKHDRITIDEWAGDDQGFIPIHHIDDHLPDPVDINFDDDDDPCNFCDDSGLEQLSDDDPEDLVICDCDIGKAIDNLIQSGIDLDAYDRKLNKANNDVIDDDPGWGYDINHHHLWGPIDIDEDKIRWKD